MFLVGAMGVAGVVGVAVAYRVPFGLALLIGLVYVPIALYRLPVGLALFIPLVFLEALPAFNLAGKASGLLLAGAWIGAAVERRAELTRAFAPQRRLLILLAGLLLWLTLSLAWAESTGAVTADIWRWYAVVLLFLIVATTAATTRNVKLMAAAFVGGAVLSILIGFATGKFNDGSALASAANANARLEGALGDPNFLASGAIAAIVMAAALVFSTRAIVARWGLFVAIAVLTAGLLTSQSRGGFLAVLVVILATVVVVKRRRAVVYLFLLLLMSAAAVFFAATPSAWERITNINNGGSGRSDLWTVGWRMFEDEPVRGVGLNNYQELAKNYTREAGTLKYVSNIAEKPKVMHNTYLQLLAETGVIGLLLFLGVVYASLRAAHLAAKRFAAEGDFGMELFAQAVLLAAIGILTASFFISAGVDKRLWIVLALGPALLAVATGRAQREESVRV